MGRVGVRTSTGDIIVDVFDLELTNTLPAQLGILRLAAIFVLA